MENTIHGGAAPARVRRVYYSGTSTLYEGYALCYDFDSYDVNSENVSQTTPNVSTSSYSDARRVIVEKPAEGNKLHFAGVVSKKSDGKTGPCWVEIHTPGSVCNVYAYADCDHGSSGITTASGQTISFCPGQWYFYTGGFPGEGTATVLQDVDRSSTAGLVMAELQVGQPSGGVHIVDVLSTATAGALSVSMSAPFAHCGVYGLVGDVAATMSIYLGTTANPGNFVGERVKIACLSVPATATYSLALSGVKVGILSAGAGGCIAGLNGTGEISLSTESFTCQWDGASWVLTGLDVISVTFA